MSLEISQPQSAVPADNKPKFDLNGYFSRIAYTGNSEPTLETFRQIHRQHAQSIPFENLNPFLRIPVDLNIDSLYEKLVLNKRGGYCFEHNLLLMEALRAIGFTVRGLAARVLWNTPEGVVTPRGHMLLLIYLEEKYFVADVGFGGLTLTTPLLLETDTAQHTPHEDFKLTRSGDDYLMLAKVQGIWKRVYSFTLQENFLQDYEVASWYLSNNPTSHFITGLIAALPFESGRHVLRNGDFATHYVNGGHERRTIENVVDLKNTLENVFRIVLPDVPHIDEYLERTIHKAIKK
jgi:N-hydroxyarylamine O-acetyltransferase